jgi:hypothetical protein
MRQQEKCGLPWVAAGIGRRHCALHLPDRRISSLASAPLAEIATANGRNLPKSLLHSLFFQAVSEVFAEA